MFLAILLSAFMLFSVLTVGATYFKMWRIQNLRLNGAEFDAIMYGATDAQMEKLKNNADITDVGVLAIAGFIDGSEKNDMADTSLVWVDDTYWNKMQAPAKKYVKGHYPGKKNEVMVTPRALEECGISDYGIGDLFRVKWTDTQGVQHNLDYRVDESIQKAENFLYDGTWKFGSALSGTSGIDPCYLRVRLSVDLQYYVSVGHRKYPLLWTAPDGRDDRTPDLPSDLSADAVRGNRRNRSWHRGRMRDFVFRDSVACQSVRNPGQGAGGISSGNLCADGASCCGNDLYRKPETGKDCSHSLAD